jgi:hypothetical protein
MPLAALIPPRPAAPFAAALTPPLAAPFAAPFVVLGPPAPLGADFLTAAFFTDFAILMGF